MKDDDQSGKLPVANVHGHRNIYIGGADTPVINGVCYSDSLFLGTYIAATPNAWFINGIEVPVETVDEARVVIAHFKAWVLTLAPVVIIPQ